MILFKIVSLTMIAPRQLLLLSARFLVRVVEFDRFAILANRRFPLFHALLILGCVYVWFGIGSVFVEGRIAASNTGNVGLTCASRWRCILNEISRLVKPPFRRCIAGSGTCDGDADNVLR